MTDRDHFAAAALTGLLSKSIAPEQAMSAYVRIASAYADAMLRERERTNHDAVPAAKAQSCEKSRPQVSLTHAERDALVELCCTGEQSPFPRDWRAAATVRKFLERMA